MSKPVAIHDRPSSFSDRWIELCRERGVPVKLVNCYDSGIISQLADCRALMWHWTHGQSKDLLMARHVILAAEQMGLKVFPNNFTCWHFDDKVAQKYFLESLQAPLIPTYAFYDRQAALDWAGRTTFPKVFKLRRGAGSLNVKLVHNARQARSLIRTAFGKGFNPVPHYLADAGSRVKKARKKGQVLAALLRLPWTLLNIRRMRSESVREKGYAYFQDFAPANKFDTRVTVIGKRAFGFIRHVRDNDFRASGSGKIDYDLAQINPACVRTALDVARRAQAQSIAFDFVNDGTDQPKIIEVSYAYMAKAVYDCPGNWDDQLAWHDGHVWPQDAILDDLLNEVQD